MKKIIAKSILALYLAFSCVAIAVVLYADMGDDLLFAVLVTTVFYWALYVFME